MQAIISFLIISIEILKGEGGGCGPRPENLPRASRDVNPALPELVTKLLQRLEFTTAS